MNHLKKCFSLVLACMFTIALSVYTVGAENKYDVKIILDGQNMEFEKGAPYLDKNSDRVMVPIRQLAEALDTDVLYDAESATIYITGGNINISLVVNDTSAIVNGVVVELDCPATIINSSTYVPLRFISENMNLNVIWNSNTRTVTLTKRHSVELGQTKSDISELFGTPDRIDTSEKGYSWNVYSSDLSNYMQIGIHDNTVVAYYLHMHSFVHSTGIRSGMSRSDCNSLMRADGYSINAKSSYTIYSKNDQIITVYFDADTKCYAMMVEANEYHNLSRINTSVLESFEKTMFDLVNVERLRANADKLEFSEALSSVAKQHSTDMAEKNYYSHINMDGQSPYQRLEHSGFSDFYSTEAISKAFPNSFCAFSSHLANSDFVSAMLARYTQFGSGCAFNADSDGILYYTQIFLAQK